MTSLQKLSDYSQVINLIKLFTLMNDKSLTREKIIFVYEFFFTALFVFCIQGSIGHLLGIPLFAFCLG